MGEVLKNPFEPALPEPQPAVRHDAEPVPVDTEPLADWIVSHETQHSDPESKLPPEKLTEIHFERRHEVKDQLEKETPQPSSVKPMVPISQVLQSRSPLPSPTDPNGRQTALGRLRRIIQPSTHNSYTLAILRGFMAGLVVATGAVVILLLRSSN